MDEDLTTGLFVLQGHLDGMLDRVHQNSETLKRLQQFEMRLLSLNSLVEMIDFILGESKQILDLDVISLCLIDQRSELSAYLDTDYLADDYRECLILIDDNDFLLSQFPIPEQPLIGSFQAAAFSNFFPGLNRHPASVIIAPLMRRGKCMGSLNLGSFHDYRFSQTMATDFIQHIASVIGICLENNLNFETLRRTSMIDPLTGVHNRRCLEQRIEEELERTQRSHAPLSCLFLDIDFFKVINDQYGHQAGDYVLISIASAIKKQLRTNDVLSRYGGEEFVALLTQCDSRTADEIAERIRFSISALALEFGNTSLSATISIGVASYYAKPIEKINISEVAAQLIKTADTALYEAKRLGRNRVESGGSL